MSEFLNCLGIVAAVLLVIVGLMLAIGFWPVTLVLAGLLLFVFIKDRAERGK